MRQLSFLLLAMIACGHRTPPPNATTTTPPEEPPVALNAEPAVQYPPALYERGVQGDVVLRLYVDSTGRLAPESTRVTETSGSAGLDSAAVRGVGRLRYAPARRNGFPISTAFLQTVQFRHAAGAAALDRASTRPATTPRPPDSTTRARSAARPAPDTTAPRRPAVPRRDTTTAPAPDTTTPPAPPVRAQPARDSTPDSTRARPDSNGAPR
jgi:TonB family protein